MPDFDKARIINEMKLLHDKGETTNNLCVLTTRAYSITFLLNQTQILMTAVCQPPEFTPLSNTNFGVVFLVATKITQKFHGMECIFLKYKLFRASQS